MRAANQRATETNPAAGAKCSAPSDLCCSILPTSAAPTTGLLLAALQPHTPCLGVQGSDAQQECIPCLRVSLHCLFIIVAVSIQEPAAIGVLQFHERRPAQHQRRRQVRRSGQGCLPAAAHSQEAAPEWKGGCSLAGAAGSRRRQRWRAIHAAWEPWAASATAARQ